MDVNLVPVVAIVMGIGIAMWSIYWDHQTKRLKYEERRQMIEKGMAPPPVLDDEGRRPTPEDHLRRGVIMSFLAAGLGIAALVLARVDGPPAWLLLVAASIVGFLGLGCLVYYFIAKNRTPVQERP